MSQADSQISSPSQFLHFEIPQWECWTLQWPCWSRWHPTDHLLSASASHCSTKHRLIWLQTDLEKTNFWCRHHFHLTISCGPETKVLDSVYYQEPISATVTPLWRFKIARWKEGTYKSYKSVIQTCFSGLTWLTKEESGRSGMLGSVRHWGGMSQHALRGGHSAGDTVNCWSHR